MAAVDILLSVHNGMPFLPEQIRSVQAQSHVAWRLWVRDDLSTDGSADVVRAFASDDARIRLLGGPDVRLGASRSFGLLLETVLERADYVMLCDADDVWLPDKIATTLAAMRAAEARRGPGEVLVHTDLTVVDAGLGVLAASFWEYQGLRPERHMLGDMLVRSTVTGPTVMMNGALARRVGSIPSEAVYQDWWVALVAACFGRIVWLPERTVLYRQHGRNSEGATGPGEGLLGRARRGWSALSDPERLRVGVDRTAAQATAFLDRYETELTPTQRLVLKRYAAIGTAGPLVRKLSVLRVASVPEHGWVRRIARALRV